MVVRKWPLLKIRISESETAEIDLQFMSLKRAYCEEPRFRSAVYVFDNMKSYLVAGRAAGGDTDHFGAIYAYFDNLEILLPKTAMVESHFSMIGRKKEV